MPRRCGPRSLPSLGGAGNRWGGGPWGHVLGLLALVLGLFSADGVWARRGDDRRAALLRQAQPLVDKGVAALTAKDFATATKILGSAYRSAPVPEVLLQLARLAQAEGRTVEAYDLYRRYLSDPTRIPNEAAQREAEAVLATPPPATGSLAIIGPPSALVLIDDRIVGVLPLPQPLLLAAGKHTLMLDLGGKRRDTPLQVLAGRLSEVRTGKSSGALLISLLPALLVFDEWPGVATDTLRPFTDAIERAAIGQQMGVMPAAVALRQGTELKSCLGTLPCQQQLAKRCSLDYLLRSRVVREAPPAAPGSAVNDPKSTPGPTRTGVSVTTSPAGSFASATTSPAGAVTSAATSSTSAVAAVPSPTSAATTTVSSPTGAAATAVPSSPAGAGATAVPSSPAGARETSPAPSPTANWSFELALVQVEVAEPASKAALTCPACTAEQAAARYRDALIDVLGRGLPRQLGTAQLTSEPAAAEVTLATRLLGKTPLHVALWEGSYDLTLTHPGYQPTAQTLAIAAGKETSLNVTLPPVEQPPAVPTANLTVLTPRPTGRLPRPRWRLALGGTLLSAGAMLLTMSAAYGSRNLKDCADDTTPPLGAQCKQVYDYSVPAGTTLGIGLVFGIAGTVLMAIPGPRAN